MSIDEAIDILGLDPDIPLDVFNDRSSATRGRRVLQWFETQQKGLFYRRPVDMRPGEQRESAIGELGQESTAPTDEGLYYMISVKSSAPDGYTLMLIPGNGVVDFVRRHHALTVADTEHRLLTYLGPVDPTAPGPARRLADIFGPATILPDTRDHFLITCLGRSMLVAGADVFTVIVDLYALRLAANHGLLTRHGPADVDMVTDRVNLFHEHGWFAVPGPESGQFHHVDIHGRSVLIPVGDAPKWVTPLAVLAGLDAAADELSYLNGIVL